VIFSSPLPSVEIPDVAVSTLVFQHADRLADKPAVTEGHTGRALTYGQLLDLTKRFAGGLVARGFQKGDVVAILSPNVPEYAAAFHGTLFAGCVATTFNPTYTDREINHQLHDSDSRIMVTVGPLVGLALAASADTSITEIAVLGPIPDDLDTSVAPNISVFPVTDLLGEPLAEQVPVAADDLAVLPYSSGTTGLSKGVMLTHGNLVANVVQALGIGTIDSEDAVLDAVLPFFHIYGMQVLMNAALAAGASFVCLPRFDLEQFLDMHQTYKVTHSFLAPPIVLALAKHPMVDNYDLSNLRYMMSGAAPLSAELAAEAAARLKVDVVQGYGMTEMAPVSHATPPGRNRPGTVGLTAPNTECQIVDPGTGQAVGVGEEGELWVRGPQIMAGYLNNTAATEATLTEDGWLRTGDLGHFDADGYLVISDRLKELIKFKGFQVPPAELEGLLLTHPAVADAGVIGRPDDEAGELPIGFVVLKPGADATAAEVQTFVNDQVANYKNLHEVNLIEAIPKSASGKILRRQLREL
jgi:4-coumarate--CoA ligase